jgi:hypothetical protein
MLQQWDETFSDDGKVNFSPARATVWSCRDLAKWMHGDASTTGSRSGFSKWQHLLSVPRVTIEGGTAKARTDFFATHRGRGDRRSEVHHNSLAAFHDELVRKPKGWRIQFRRREFYFGDLLEIARPTE